MADIPDQCIFLEVASFGHLVRWSFMQINKTRLLSICNAAESLHWLACKWCSVVSGSMYYTHFIALQYKALWGGCGGFLFCWNSKFGNMHAPKMSRFVQIFQNCFCFRSRTFSSHVGNYFGLQWEYSRRNCKTPLE